MDFQPLLWADLWTMWLINTGLNITQALYITQHNMLLMAMSAEERPTTRPGWKQPYLPLLWSLISAWLRKGSSVGQHKRGHAEPLAETPWADLILLSVRSCFFPYLPLKQRRAKMGFFPQRTLSNWPTNSRRLVHRMKLVRNHFKRITHFSVLLHEWQSALPPHTLFQTLLIRPCRRPREKHPKEEFR